MTPGSAVQFYNEREGACAARLEETSQQRVVRVAEILDVFRIEIVIHQCFGFHDSLLLLLTHHR